MLRQQRQRTIIRLPDQAIDLLVDDAGRSLAIVARTGGKGGTGEGVLALAKGDRAQLFAHSPASNHLARNGGDTLQIVLRSGGDAPNRNLLGGTSAKSRDHLRFKKILRIVIAIIQ